jgi:hypothetical protein
MVAYAFVAVSPPGMSPRLRIIAGQIPCRLRAASRLSVLRRGSISLYIVWPGTVSGKFAVSICGFAEHEGFAGAKARYHRAKHQLE